MSKIGGDINLNSELKMANQGTALHCIDVSMLAKPIIPVLLKTK